jgi:hypothetical protein
MTQDASPATDDQQTPEAIRETTSTSEVTPAFGWTRYAELINGRFAMIGFIALLLLEFFTRQDFFTWLGL